MTQMDLLAWTPPYPLSPGHKVDGTSRLAAEDIRPRAGILRGRVLACLRANAMTADECAYALSESVLAIRPRFSELRALNQITDTGERRQNDSGRNAIVWRAA
jgi:hypothetical protein